MKKLLTAFVKTFSIWLCVTVSVIPQGLLQYTKTLVNGEERWTLNKQDLSIFDEKEPSRQQIDWKNIYYQKQVSFTDNFGDDRWTLQQPYPTDTYLLATEAENDFIISTGFGGLFSNIYSDLIISTDNGENWTIRRFDTDSLLSSMDKYDNLIWLGGIELMTNNGFILKSTDFGKNWVDKLSVDSFAVMYVNFFDATNGVVVCEKELSSGSTSLKIFHTSDGGGSWNANYYSYQGREQGLKSIHFSNHNEGWICIHDPNASSIGRIINTNDGGMNWVTQFTDSLEEFVMIHFADLNNGWAAGVWKDHPSFSSELRIYSTTDGGSNWFQQFTVEDDFYAIYGCDVYSLDSLNCWLAVSNWPYLKIFRTIDGGNNWNEISQLENIDFQLGDIEYVSATEGWITAGGGSIYFSSDGGYFWDPKHKSVTTQELCALDFVDTYKGWAIGGASPSAENILIKTENGGNDWSIIRTDTTDLIFKDLSFISSDTGFLISNNQMAHPFYGLLEQSSDGGISWNQTLYDSSKLEDIIFSDSNNGWIVGKKNTDPFILHTSDSGNNWVQQTNINLSGGGLNYVDFSDEYNGFAIGDASAVLKTTNGGNSWGVAWGNLDPNLFWINYRLTGVYLTNSSTCWISGYKYGSINNGAMILHTTNSGTTWDTLSIPSNFGSGQIVFLNNNTGYCICYSKTYKTTDGGVTWLQIEYPSSINKMYFLNEGLGWALGSSGRIFKYYDPNVGVEEESIAVLPDNFILMQNYPNPFNPSTTIKFSIPETGNIKLKVYDILGNEVATLVNEEKAPGNYSVEWNASSLASGVYVYRLTAGSFVQTRKMILMK
jgi:photosystem II stability/assembly factor-like uncharacterized protein